VLTQEIGIGSIATVYRATSPTDPHSSGTPSVVAIKVIRDAPERDQQLIFKREAQAAQILTHPNIARLFDVGFDNDLPFLVFEFFAGGTLRDALRSVDRMPNAEVRNVASQSCTATSRLPTFCWTGTFRGASHSVISASHGSPDRRGSS
jgi:serine/threonine-protein kinase